MRRTGVLVVALLLPAIACAQGILGTPLRPVAIGTTESTYQCQTTPARGKDVVIKYENTPPSLNKSRVTALTVRGEVLDERKLSRINAAIGKRGIETVTVTCNATLIQIALTVFNPESARVDYVVLSKRKDASLEVLL